MADQNLQNWLKTNAPSKNSKVSRQLILPSLEEGGKADTLNLTDPEYNRYKLGEYSKAIEKNEKAAESEAKKEATPEFSVKTDDDINITNVSLSAKSFKNST